jgi:hypothetical protein
LSPWKVPGVWYQPERGAVARLPQCRQVASHEAHLDVGPVDPRAGAAQGLLHDVGAGVLPAALASCTPQTR